MGKSESNRQENPSLAAALLGMSPEAFLNDWQTFSLVFENLCMRDLSAYARTLNLLDDVPVRYYRDDSGLEADAICVDIGRPRPI